MSRFLLLRGLVMGILFAGALVYAQDATARAPSCHEADIVRVIDGDTLDVIVDLSADAAPFLSVMMPARIRLRGINAMEIRGFKDKTREHPKARAAWQRLAEIASAHVLLCNVVKGKYHGRFIADVCTEAKENIGKKLLEEKLVEIYKKSEPPASVCG